MYMVFMSSLLTPADAFNQCVISLLKALFVCSVIVSCHGNKVNIAVADVGVLFGLSDVPPED
jgi:hypothetical protein